MVLTVELTDSKYDIEIGRGVIQHAGQCMDLGRKVLVVTDTGVPKEYSQKIKDQCREGYIVTLPSGEKTKNLDNVRRLLSFMLSKGFSRKDAVVAVGGGVIGDLAGFAASVYMRGIDFYNVPTTILSQVDSSIGGKVAVDFEGYKNIVGAFYQPKAVIVDIDTLDTLPKRQWANGLVEAVKTGVIGDAELFDIFENKNPYENVQEIIVRSLTVKRNVVQQDPKESGLRKIGNFGHTVGHGVEAVSGDLLHGECVAIGMMYVSSADIRRRLLDIYEKLGLKELVTGYINGLDEDVEAKVLEAMGHDKKAVGNKCSAVVSDEVGSCQIKEVDICSLFPKEVLD